VKNRILALPCLALFAASLAVAQTPTKIGVVQIQAALLSTKDGQKAAQEFQTRIAPKQKDMERKRTEIQELQDKLSKGGNAMAQAAKDELSRNIEGKTKSFNRDMEDAQAEAQAEERKMLEELSGKMQVVIDKYGQANGYAVLLDVSNQNSNVIYMAVGIDVTKEIIEAYDKINPGGPGTAKPATPSKPTATTPAPAAKPPVTTPKKQP
jgi:outer membrane protein